MFCMISGHLGYVLFHWIRRICSLKERWAGPERRQSLQAWLLAAAKHNFSQEKLIQPAFKSNEAINLQVFHTTRVTWQPIRWLRHKFRNELPKDGLHHNVFDSQRLTKKIAMPRCGVMQFLVIGQHFLRFVQIPSAVGGFGMVQVCSFLF